LLKQIDPDYGRILEEKKKEKVKNIDQLSQEIKIGQPKISGKG